MFRFVRNKKGQGMTEYALIIGLLAVAIFAAFKFFDLGGIIDKAMTKVTTGMDAAK